jgi:hypothetical protein
MEIREGTIAAILALAPFQLPLLDRSDACDVRLTHARHSDEILIQDAHSTTGDRSHGQLFVPRQTELADDKDIEWNLQGARDLISDWYAATRQGQNEHIRSMRVRAELCCETAAGVAAIAKARDHGSAPIAGEDGA